MNASGNYRKTFSARDLLGERDPAPPKSNMALRNALIAAGKTLPRKASNG